MLVFGIVDSSQDLEAEARVVDAYLLPVSVEHLFLVTRAELRNRICSGNA